MKIPDGYLETFDSAIALADLVCTRALEVAGRRSLPVRKVQVFVGLLCKAVQTTRAVLLLLSEDLEREAHALTRTLLDVTLNLVFLAPDRDMELVNRYVHHCAWERKKAAMDARALPEMRLTEVVPENYPESVEERAVADLGEEVWATIRDSGRWVPNPADPTKTLGPEQMCREAAAKELYPLVFRIGSSTLHANDYDDYVGVEASPDGQTANLRSLAPLWGLPALAGVAVLLPACIKALVIQFDTGQEEELAALERKVGDLESSGH